jgi:hypothetical protein
LELVEDAKDAVRLAVLPPIGMAFDQRISRKFVEVIMVLFR